MKIFAVFLMVLLGCGEGSSFVSPPYYNPYNAYNPGPGYLQPSYSFQQPSWGAQPAFPPVMPFQPRPGYGAPSAFGQQQGGGITGFLTCTAMSCGSLKGFKQCLASPTSPYRYFIFHPQAITDIRAYQRLRAFTTVHPKCYAQFCNRVCSMVPQKFHQAAAQNPGQVPQEFPDDESISDFSDEGSSVSGSQQSVASGTSASKKASWLSRQKDWLLKNDRWKAREFEKRSSVQTRVDSLCTRDDLVGKEIRLLCSECAAYLKDDRQMIPACDQGIHYKAPPNVSVKEKTRRASELYPGGPVPDESWGARDLEERQEEARLRLQAQKEQRAMMEQQRAANGRRTSRLPARDAFQPEELYGDPYLDTGENWASPELVDLRRQDELRERLEEQREEEKRLRQEERRQREEAQKRQQQGQPREAAAIEAEIKRQEAQDEAASDTASRKSGSSQRSSTSSLSAAGSQQSLLTAANLARLTKGQGASLPKGQGVRMAEWQAGIPQPKRAPSVSGDSEDGFSEMGSDDGSEEGEGDEE